MKLYIKELVNGNVDWFLDNIGKSGVPYFLGMEIFKQLYENNIDLVNKMEDEEKIKTIFELLVFANTHNVVYVPREFLTKKMLEYVVVVRGNKIIFLNEEFKPEFHAMIVFDFYPACINQNSLDTYITKDNWLEKIKKDSNYIKYIPKEYINQKLCDDVIRDNPDLIKYIPVKYRSRSICMKAYDHNYRNIKFVLDEYKTKQMCLDVIKKDPKLIKYFPLKLRDSEMYEYVAENAPTEIKSIPEQFINEKIIKIAQKKNALTPLMIDIIESKSFFIGYMDLEYNEVNDYIKKQKTSFKTINVLTEIIQKYNPDLYEKYISKLKGFYVQIIMDYTTGDYKGKKEFLEKRNTDEKTFFTAVNYVKKNNIKLYNLYRKKANLNSENYTEAVTKATNFVKTSIFSKTKKLNSIRYYLKTNVNPNKILMELNPMTTTGRKFKKIILNGKNIDNIKEIDIFKEETYIKDGNVVSDDIKEEIVKFLFNNSIPINMHTLNLALSMYLRGLIDITKIYEKEITYEGSGDELEEIRKKSDKIKEQIKLISEMNVLEEQIIKIKENEVKKSESIGASY